MTQTMQSKIIYADDVVITKAQVNVVGSGTSLIFELGVASTPTGTYTWETIPTLTNYTHTFTATGRKYLKWRATGTNYVITKIEVKANP